MTSPAGGYFSAPRLTLDPALFDGDRLRGEVRAFILNTVRNGLKDFGLSSSARWLHVWLAGSGISYQWGNGDLDILLGVDYGRFTKYNPDYAGVDEEAAAAAVNKWLKKNVWSLTRQVNFSGSIYEATFYWTPHTGYDITQISPYAAYDVRAGSWVVSPPQLPHNPAELFDPSWYAATAADRAQATEMLARYRSASRKYKGAQPGSPQMVNAQTLVNTSRAQAHALMDSIHLGRREAFGEQGHGYRDWHNFRWQRAKATGVIRDLKKISAGASVDPEITGAQEALRRAELWKSGRMG
jgi:hypothetical protein